MKQALVIVLALVVATPAFTRGHGAGSTAAMCSTCTHRVLCRFDELFSCDRSKLDAKSQSEPKDRSAVDAARDKPVAEPSVGKRP